jgi:hypothetical protein
MKRIALATLPFLLSVAACSAADADKTEPVGEIDQAVNGAVNGAGFLTFRNFASASENARRVDTTAYYNTTGTNADGTGQSITVALGNLNAFKTKYFTGFTDVSVKYYNRGDLGLGREMHCVDRTSGDGQIACYVTNFVAAPLESNGDFSEFSFGMSPNIAFDNMLATQPRPVATVAMVFRPSPATGKDQIIFMVYDAAGGLTNTAPLDRHGLRYSNEFKTNPNPDPEKFGTPGVHFNNHIPSNCLNCHGGSYDPSLSPKVTSAFFLPFDLDQFEYKNASGLRRSDQLTPFRNLNQLVRRVAFKSTGNNIHNPVVEQIDGWHGNLVARSQTLTSNFNSNYVPEGWAGNSADTLAYRTVVRPACRGCHMAVNKGAIAQFHFNTAADFQFYSGIAAQRIKDHVMPHALQTQRDFFQSSPNLALIKYWEQVNPSAASTLKGARGNNIITLDPHLIATTF